MLILNSFRGHLVETIEQDLQDQNAALAIIHDGLTSLLQPLDVSINKLFKDHFHHFYTGMMAS